MGAVIYPSFTGNAPTLQHLVIGEETRQILIAVAHCPEKWLYIGAVRTQQLRSQIILLVRQKILEKPAEQSGA